MSTGKYEGVLMGETHRFLNENDVHLLLIVSFSLEPYIFPTDSLEKI